MCNIALTNLRCKDCHHWTQAYGKYGYCSELAEELQRGTLIEVKIEADLGEESTCYCCGVKAETHKEFGCKLFKQRTEMYEPKLTWPDGEEFDFTP